jgi:CHAD domain-containing protein
MKRKRISDKTVRAKRLAPFCLCGAQSALHYLHTLLTAMEGVRQAEDSECLHHTRVASRRLRSILPLFTECLSRQTCNRWRKHLRRLTRALGAARDTDVQMAWAQHFLDHEASTQERPGVERLLLRLQQQRYALHPPVIKALDRFVASQCSDEMEERLAQLAEDTQASDGDVPGRSVYRTMRKLIRQRLKALQAYAPYVQQPECHAELHAMRIAAKRLRYTMQAFAPLYADALKEPIGAAETLQTLLGDIRDCDVWAQELSQFLEAERDRTLVYFGQTEPFAFLVPGLLALQHNRQQYREQRYAEFVTFWHQTQEQGTWESLQQTLQAAAAHGSHSAADAASRPAEDTASAPVASPAETAKEVPIDEC